MAMAAKAAEAAADVERLLAQVLSQRPDRLMAQQASEPSDGTAPPSPRLFCRRVSQASTRSADK